ncbi:hypothetical protein ACFHYQ_24195 [Sphaerimonospora cavernae]|uniref:Uncharacterized protein n=1 Tax=Sphaerimonospora cavernae TaxID=1740611 RepID=A0ABV6UB99_9ACTN
MPTGSRWISPPRSRRWPRTPGRHDGVQLGLAKVKANLDQRAAERS